MSQPDAELILQHMLDYAREAAEMARGRTRADLDTNRMLNLALVRWMEVIGEAATRLTWGRGTNERRCRASPGVS